jgi:hypothetical protein
MVAMESGAWRTGAPRGVKPLGRRAGQRKASGSGGKCAIRSAARKAYAAMQSVA